MKVTKQDTIIIVFITLLLAINLPYLLHFSKELSDSTADWANYATYISGLLTPLISLSGLYLLIREYTKSIKIRNEDTILKVIGNIEDDLKEILNYEIKYRITPNTKEQKITFIGFLRFDISTKFSEIKIVRGGIDVKTKLTFEIVLVVNALYLMYTNISKLSDEYIEYFNNKYFYLLNYLFYNRFYATTIIETDTTITENKNVQRALTFLSRIWTIGRQT